MADPAQFRFKQQHPNIPSKNPSLSKERWEGLKPMISGLLLQGVPISEILKRLESMHIHVTRSQITTQLNKWGITKDRAQLHQGPRLDSQVAPVVNQNSAEASFSDMDTEALPSERRAIMDFEAVATLQQLESLKIEIDTTNQPENADASRLLGESSTNLMDETGPDAALCVPSIGDLTALLRAFEDPYVLPTKSPLADRAQIFDMESEVAIYSTFDMPPYELSSLNLDYQQLFMHIHLSAPNDWSIIDGLSHMGMLLINMTCFSDAFDVLFFVTSTLNDAMRMRIWFSRPHFLFIALSCIRSAYTLEQKQAAKKLMRRLRIWVERTQPYGEPGSARCIRELLRIGVDGQKEQSLDDRAIWNFGSALPLVLPLPTMVREGKESVPDYFYLSQEVQETMLFALSLIQHGQVTMAAWKLEYLFRNGLPAKPTDLAHDMLFQLLADPRVPYAQYLHDKVRPSQGNSRFLDRLSGQAFVTLITVVCLRWKLRDTDESTDLRWHEHRLLAGLDYAITDVRQALESGPGTADYRKVIDEYLRLSLIDPSEQVRAVRLRTGAARIAARVAGMESILSEAEAFISNIWRPMQLIETTDTEMISSAASSDLLHQEPEKSFARDPWPGPTLARSLRSSISSSFRLFKSAGRRSTASISQRSMSTMSIDRLSERMSWRFSVATGMSSNPSIR
ncbi:hypothetical protein CLAIMM_11214 [Cladophialophora immunda]|nr:hypothetical protein CLAIMM_11214 [Cladophialophora immunda]